MAGKGLMSRSIFIGALLCVIATGLWVYGDMTFASGGSTIIEIGVALLVIGIAVWLLGDYQVKMLSRSELLMIVALAVIIVIALAAEFMATHSPAAIAGATTTVAGPAWG